MTATAAAVTPTMRGRYQYKATPDAVPVVVIVMKDDGDLVARFPSPMRSDEGLTVRVELMPGQFQGPLP